jgi:SAM-dependent methyltransferase
MASQQHVYWNHNVAYQPVVLDAVPANCATALDVGCGDGMLARRLAAGPAKHVTGIDLSPRMVGLARELSAEVPNTTFLQGDFLTHDLPEEGFDLVCSVTAVHQRPDRGGRRPGHRPGRADRSQDALRGRIRRRPDARRRGRHHQRLLRGPPRRAAVGRSAVSGPCRGGLSGSW